MNDRAAVDRYHDGTKHHVDRFARSLGYLDWASQPAPFRRYDGAVEIPLSPRPDAASSALALVGDVLRHALGLSAWKRFNTTRWSLRVNPSSGNLHPTEAYVALPDGVFHYASDRHALERRCACALPLADDAFLVALTSIHWREAWKYGERAFRYCQHDIGHAIAAVAIAANQAGLQARLLPEWSHHDLAALTGVDRDEDFVDAEREEPACVIALSRDAHAFGGFDPEAVLRAVGTGVWAGRASQLSEDHVEWTIIDEVARATRRDGNTSRAVVAPPRPAASAASAATAPTRYSHALVLRRRSAVALDGRSSMRRDDFIDMLRATMPSNASPFDALWWDARIHLAIFVHRVDGLDAGLYLVARDADKASRLRDALQRDFAWTPIASDIPLFCLALGDARTLARRLSCDQDIAADGCFSLGMLAAYDTSLDEFGAPFYRALFWEAGLVGHVLYLEAERAGLRGTGIGCFYDDAVHDVLGAAGHAVQSLYHFTVGVPVEDARLTTEPGYEWEPRTSSDRS